MSELCKPKCEGCSMREDNISAHIGTIRGLEDQLAAVTAERDELKEILLAIHLAGDDRKQVDRELATLRNRNRAEVAESALTAAIKRAEKAEAALRNLVRYAELVEFSCLSDSCGCTGSCRPNEVHEVFTSIADVPDANAVVAAFAKSMREVVRRAKASGGVKRVSPEYHCDPDQSSALAMAPEHHPDVLPPGGGSGRTFAPASSTTPIIQVVLRNQHDYIAGMMNPILEPPTQGGENPGAV